MILGEISPDIENLVKKYNIVKFEAGDKYKAKKMMVHNKRKNQVTPKKASLAQEASGESKTSMDLFLENLDNLNSDTENAINEMNASPI